MSRDFDKERLLALLPEIYRSRDAEFATESAPGPLAGLIEILAEQIGVLEESLDRAYDDLFIETCAPWLVPYIGALVGYRPIPGMAEGAERAHVAHLIASRRRKGSRSMLEALARDVSGWAARIVEYRERTAVTYSTRRSSLGPTTARLRVDLAAHASDVALGTTAYGGSVRATDRTGAYTPASVGVHLWRIRSYGLTDVPATAAREHGPRAYYFHPAGVDTALFTATTTRRPYDVPEIGDPDLPIPISRERLRQHLPQLVGHEKAITIVADGRTIPPDEIVVRDLARNETSWDIGDDGRFAIDPQRGRLVVPQRVHGFASIRLSYHYGFGFDIGGGPYDRDIEAPLGVARIAVGTQASLAGALRNVTSDTIVEITNSDTYDLEAALAIPAHVHLTLRAFDGQRPALRLERGFAITGERGSRCTLDGFAIVAGTLRFDNRFDTVRIQDCTIHNRAHDTTALEFGNDVGRVFITRCIVGTIHIRRDSELTIESSIVDGGDPNRTAISAGPGIAGELIVDRSTIVGTVETTLLRSASNSLFTGFVRSERFADGCARYCYFGDESQTPPKYACIENDLASFALVFESLRFGDPAYAALAGSTSREIRMGADDGGEIGAYHAARWPARERAVRTAIAGAVPAGMDVDVFFAT